MLLLAPPPPAARRSSSQEKLACLHTNCRRIEIAVCRTLSSEMGTCTAVFPADSAVSSAPKPVCLSIRPCSVEFGHALAKCLERRSRAHVKTCQGGSIGRASGREGECKYVRIWVVAVYLKKKH